MAASLETYILDNGLTKLDTETTHIVLCASEPTVLSLCSVGAANALGYKSFGAGNVFTTMGNGTPNGREVTSYTVTDGTIVTSGSAVWWAVIDGTTRMHAHGSLSGGGQSVTTGNTFTLSVFTIKIPASA